MKDYNLKHFAHLGDSVWELFVREKVIDIANTQKRLHIETTKRVNANFQAALLQKLVLSDKELELVKRGRNLPITPQKRSTPMIHRSATAFEVLIGYLYLNDKKRLYEIFEFISQNGL